MSLLYQYFKNCLNVYPSPLDGRSYVQSKVGRSWYMHSRSFNFQLSNSWLSCSFSCFATYFDCVIVSHPQTGSLEKAAEEKEVQFKCQCGFH